MLRMTKTERMRDILEPIAHQLQSPQELDRVLAAIASETAERLGAEGCRIWLIRRGDLCQTCRWASGCSDQRRCLHLKAGFGVGLDTAFRRAPLDVFANDIVARGGVADWSSESHGMRFLVAPEWAQERRITSFVVQPLRVENRVLGLMAAFSAHPLQEADFHRCAVFAASASAAIRVAEQANRIQRAETAVQEKNREWRQTSRLFNAVLNSPTENAIVVEDLEGNILAFNEGARQMYGYAPEEVVGVANSERLYAPEDWATGRVMDMFKATLAQGMHEGVIRRVRKNGEIFQEQAIITVHRDEDGDPAGFVIVSRETAPAALTAKAESSEDPALRALEAVMQVRRPERLPLEVLKRFGALFPVQEAVLLLAEGASLTVRAAFGYPSPDALEGLRVSAAESPSLFKLMQARQPQEVTDEVLPEGSPLRTESQISPMSPRWAIPLCQNEPAGVALLAPPPNMRYDETALASGLRFGKLAASMFDQLLLIEQTNAQLQYLQDSYAALYQQNQIAGDQIATLERSLEQATKIAVRREAEYAEMMRRCGQLEQDSSELSTYTLQLETALRSVKQRWAGLSGKFEGAKSLATHIDELEAVVAQLSEEKRKLASNLAEAQEHYELAHRRLSERNGQLERMLADSQRELNERDMRCRALEAHVAGEPGDAGVMAWHDAERAALKSRNERLEREIAAAAEALREQEARAGRAELASSLAFEQRDAARQEADGLRRMLAEARRRLGAAKASFIRTDEMVSPLRPANAAHRMTPAGLIEPTVDARAFSDLEKRYRRLAAEADILRTELMRAQSAAARVRDVQAACDRLEEAERARLMQIQAFEATVEVLEAERAAFDAENQNLSAQVRALQEAAHQFEGERATTAAALNAIAHEAEVARNRLRELDAVVIRLESEKATLAECVAALEGEATRTRESLESVAEEAERVRHRAEESEAVAARIDVERTTLLERVARLEDELTQATCAMNENERVADAARLELQTMEERAARSEAELALIKEAMDESEREGEAARLRAAESESIAARLEAEKSDLTARIAQLDEKLSHVADALAESEGEAERARKEYERRAAENDMLREAIAEHVGRMDEYAQRQVIREAQIVSVMRRLDALNEERAAWRVMLGRADLRESEFRERAAADARTIDALRGELDALHSARAYVETEIAAIQSRFEAIQDSYRESVAQMETRLENAIRATAELAAQAELAKRDIAERDAAQAALRERLEATAYEKALAEERLEQATSLAAERIRALDALRATLSPPAGALESDGGADEELAARIAHLERENEDWAARYAEAESQWRLDFMSLEASINTARTLNDILLKRAEVEKAELSSHVSKLQSALDAAQLELEAMRREAEATTYAHPMNDAPAECDVSGDEASEAAPDEDWTTGTVELDLDPADEPPVVASAPSSAPLVLEETDLNGTAAAPPAFPNGLQVKRVAVASDRREERQALESWLDVIGWRPSWAESGDEMLSILMTEEPDVLILGLENPEFDNFELQRRMRRNPDWRKIPTLLLLSEADAKEAAHAPDSGVRILYSDQLTPDSFCEALRALAQ
jgi:PAS domain S-box-containing protein